jgi:hypothetical protein
MCGRQGIDGTGATVQFNHYGDDKIMRKDLMIVMVVYYMLL